MMNEIKKVIVLLSLTFLTGIISGWVYGTCIINQLIKGNIGISTFFFLPSKNIIDTYIMLNSGNDFKRLEGYYAYSETGLRDFDFLYNRYKIEESILIKKTIIWLLEYRETPEKMGDIYKKLYEVSPESLKKHLQVKINYYDLKE